MAPTGDHQEAPYKSCKVKDNDVENTEATDYFDGRDDNVDHIGNDPPSFSMRENDSITAGNCTPYTPSYSPSDGRLSSDETFTDQDPLLSDLPPRYQEVAPIPVEWSRQAPREDDIPAKKLRGNSPISPLEPDTTVIGPRGGKWLVAMYFLLLSSFTIFIFVVLRQSSRVQASYTPVPQLATPRIAEFKLTFPQEETYKNPTQGEYGTEFRPTRDIIVDNGQNSIWGRYPLYDLLSLTTTSGDIAVTVEPQPADSQDPLKSARLVIRSQSGSVRVSFSSPAAASMPELQGEIERHLYRKTGNLEVFKSLSEKPHMKPPLQYRPYELDIETASGSVSGRYIFSAAASIRTQSGSINVLLVPIVSVDLNSPGSCAADISLLTSSGSGRTELHMTEPYFAQTLTNTRENGLSPNAHHDRSCSKDFSATSSHTSTGPEPLRISYPQSWAGNISALGLNRASARTGYHDDTSLSHGDNSDKVSVSYRQEPGIHPSSETWWGGEGIMAVTVRSEGGEVDFWSGS
ncbi:hypothetical protein FQN54_008408 [Arachnomyces sp. PD_36]|nr:hypothetical protein FQN54_008408 [Arachnomyces sp. PD_36]